MGFFSRSNYYFSQPLLYLKQRRNSYSNYSQTLSTMQNHPASHKRFNHFIFIPCRNARYLSETHSLLNTNLSVIRSKLLGVCTVAVAWNANTLFANTALQLHRLQHCQGRDLSSKPALFSRLASGTCCVRTVCE